MSRWEPDAEGRLIKAALTLFEGQGYERTTVAEIAATAGLTKRTFFRYFTDKREVLFRGSSELQQVWIAAVLAAQADAGPMAAISAGLDQVARLFVDRHAFARLRSGIIVSHPELQERELIKLQVLTADIQAALEHRDVPRTAATLAAHTGVTVFHLAFARWVEQDDPTALRELMTRSMAELRAVITQA